MIIYRTLTESDFFQLFQATHDAFSNYAVPYKTEQDSLRRLFLINGVRFDLSVGAFDGEKMVGFTVNGLGRWNDRITSYDSGTGVIQNYRRQGISRKMFEFVLPILRANNIEQYLLEVITNNEPAVKLYRNLDFKITRKLGVYKRKEKISVPVEPDKNVEIKEIKKIDWDLFKSFWTYFPSWQNSVDAINRSFADKTIRRTFLGLYLSEKFIGYGVVFHNSGNIPQFVIDEKYRGNNYGRMLLNALQNRIEKPLFVSNVDTSAKDASAFLESNGFSLLTTQQEMRLEL